MSAASWSLNGQYYETCSCDFVCPCVLGQMAAPPSKGSCTFAMAFDVDRGTYGATSLNGLRFLVIGFTPREMIAGDWAVGLIIDDRASAEQRDAIATIASGKAGGPMAALAGLIGRFLGVEQAAIRFERTGVRWSVSASSLIDMAADGAMGVNPAATAPLELANTGHPASDRLILAHASRSHVHALGLSWDDESGRNNGQYAPFAWRSA
jgi:hypothetical protein